MTIPLFSHPLCVENVMLFSASLQDPMLHRPAFLTRHVTILCRRFSDRWFMGRLKLSFLRSLGGGVRAVLPGSWFGGAGSGSSMRLGFRAADWSFKYMKDQG